MADKTLHRWFGGGYVVGSKDASGSPWGLYAAAEKPFIFVAANYRLGALGFLAPPDADVDTNIGLHDARMAMEWIGTHIRKFGGDTGRMTAIGLSAGAGVIMHAIVSYGGKGPKLPFQQVRSPPVSLRVRVVRLLTIVVLAGDTAVAGLGAGGRSGRPHSAVGSLQGEHQVRQRHLHPLAAVGGGAGRKRDDHRSVDVRSAWVDVGAVPGGGWRLHPGLPSEASQRRQVPQGDQERHILQHALRGNRAAFAPPKGKKKAVHSYTDTGASQGGIYVPANITDAEFPTFIGTQYSPNATIIAKIAAAYPGDGTGAGAYRRAVEAVGDMVFNCNGYWLARAFSSDEEPGHSARRYMFNLGAAIHGSDLPYTWNGGGGGELAPTPVNATLAAMHQRLIVDYTLRGDRALDGWPEWTEDRAKAMWLNGTGLAVGPDYYAWAVNVDRCEFLKDEIIGRG